MLWHPAAPSLPATRTQVFQGFSWVGCVHLSALDILIAVSTLECSAGPWPGWLQGPALCCCFRYAAGAEQSPGTAGFEAQRHVITGDLLAGRQRPRAAGWESQCHVTTGEQYRPPAQLTGAQWHAAGTGAGSEEGPWHSWVWGLAACKYYKHTCRWDKPQNRYPRRRTPTWHPPAFVCAW